MREQQGSVAVRPKNKFEALQQALYLAQQCMLEKDRIIDGLRFSKFGRSVAKHTS